MGKVTIPRRLKHGKPFILMRGCRGKHVAWQGGDISNPTRKVRKMLLHWHHGSNMHACMLSSMLKWVFFRYFSSKSGFRRIIVVVVKLLEVKFLCCLTPNLNSHIQIAYRWYQVVPLLTYPFNIYTRSWKFHEIIYKSLVILWTL